MAENRTLQFMGLGYGNTPVTITASINGEQFFSGEVQTVDQPLYPYTDDSASQVVLFTLLDSEGLNTDFAGNVSMSVTTTGDANGYGVWYGMINSNYQAGNVTVIPEAGTANFYDVCYTGNPSNSDNSTDSRSDVAITGQEIPYPRPTTGIANWCVPVGQTMTYNLNIGIGQIGNVRGNVSNYVGPYTPTAPVPSPAPV
jgi:hypothetical protein